MSKSRLPLLSVSAATLSALGASAIPANAEAAGACIAGKPSVVVHVAGFKQPQGQVKVSLYGADANLWLAKQGRISRVKMPVTSKAMDICLPVPAPGPL